MAWKPKLGRQLRRAPAQGDPGAAVAVIVDQPFVTERLGADDEARAAIGTQARDGAYHTAFVDLDRGQRRAAGDARRADRRAAGHERGGACGEGSTIKQHAASLAAPAYSSTVSIVTRSLVNTQTSDAICIARRARTSGSCS